MASVTGLLKTFGLGDLAGYQPELWFDPSGPATSGATVYFSQSVKATIDFDTKTFTVTLQPTTELEQDVWYTPRIRWLNAIGNYTQPDYPDWKVRVPPEGGVFGDLLTAPSNPAHVWVSETPPADPTPGTWWLVPSTGDLSEWTV